MAASQSDKIRAFQALHARAGAFIIPNPWDLGSMRILEGMGFEALATTSAGFAFSIGRHDEQVSRAETLDHARTIVGATDLPVSADLENGFGAAPEAAARTIAEAVKTGLAGGSIEDSTRDPKNPIYERSLAVERIAAAVEAARAADPPFVLTARAENFLHGRPDLDDTIARLQAFEAAGADVLYAPGLRDLETIRTICSALERPVNVLMGLGSGASFSVDELAQAGVSRISVGAALARAALGALIRAAEEMRKQGTFGWSAEAASFADVEAFMADPGG